MATIKIKRGDTAPALRYAFPAGVDLTDATVAFIMSPRPGGPSVVVAPAAVITAVPPVAEYTWSQGDTDTDGSYYAEFEVSFADGRVQRFPSSGYLRIDIGQWLDSSVPIGGDGPIPPQRQWLTVADLSGAIAEQVTGQVDALVVAEVLPRVEEIAATAAAPAAQAAVAEAMSHIEATISDTAAQAASVSASGILRVPRSEIAAAGKAAGRAWQDGPAIFVADVGSTAIPDIPDVSPAPWASVTFRHFHAAEDGNDWQPAIMRAQRWSADHRVPVVEPVGLTIDIMQPIEPVSNATVVLPADFVIRRRFQGGADSTYMIDYKDKPVANWHWTGGKLDGAGPAGYAGGCGRFIGTDCTVTGVVAFDYQNRPGGGAAAGWLFGGKNVWLRRCDTRVSLVGRGHHGTDAYRFIGGSDSGTEDCYAESGDDCFPFAPVTSVTSRNFDQSIIRCSHIRPRGVSYGARGVIAGIDGQQSEQMTCSIMDCLVIDGHFTDTGSYLVRVSNNRSSGLIHNLRFVRCIFDRSQDLGVLPQASINIASDPTNNGKAEPGSLSIGGIGDVYFEDCKHIAGSTGACFDIDIGKKLTDGTWLEPTSRARVYISGGDWNAQQFATIDGKVDLTVLQPTRAHSVGSTGHAVRIGFDYRAGVIDLRKLEITGVPSGYGGVRAIKAEKVYAPLSIKQVPGATGVVGIWSDSTVDHTYLPSGIEYATGTKSAGTMEVEPVVAAATALIPPRGLTYTDSDVATGWQWGQHGPSIIDRTLLTANRSRNLILAGTQLTGDVFEIARTGGDTGGPWVLNVTNGVGAVLAALATQRWARFVWTGTAWALLAQGALTA